MRRCCSARHSEVVPTLLRRANSLSAQPRAPTGPARNPSMMGRSLSRREVACFLCFAATALTGSRSSARATASDCPRGIADVRFDASARSTGWLRLDLGSDRHLRVRAEVGGISLPAIIDSGATITVVDRAWANKLRLTLREGFRAEGLTGRMIGYFADNVSVRIGNATFGDVTVGVLDQATFKHSVQNDLAIIIGQDLLRSMVVEIDFIRKRMKLHKGHDQPRRWSGAPVRLRRTQCGRHALPISVERRMPIDAVFDLGSNVPLYLAPDYAEAVELLKDRKTSTSVTAGGEGLALGQVTMLSCLEIGGAAIPKVPVVVPAAWNDSRPALVGWPVLSKFHMIMDLGHDVLWLRPEPDAIREPLPKDRSGLGTTWDRGHLRIVHVARGSPAEAIGLKAGESIIAVDGKRVDLHGVRNRPRLGSRPAGTVYVLTMADGSAHKLILQDYY